MQDMRTVAKENIKERIDFFRNRSLHRATLVNEGNSDIEVSYDIVYGYSCKLTGYVDALWHLGLITDEEHKEYIDRIIYDNTLNIFTEKLE